MKQLELIWAAEGRAYLLSGLFRFLKNANNSPAFRRGLFAAIVIVALPLCLSGSSNALGIKFWPAQEAHAAIGRGFAPVLPNIDKMTPEQKQRHAALIEKTVMKNPANINNLVGQELGMIFPEPGLKRMDGSTMVWQYRNKSCVLDVYLDPVTDTDYAPVVHYEIRQRLKASLFDRAPEKQNMDQGACLSALFRKEI